ncbi:MAG: 3,4-dihydroxy-2-butanone-4-phosphate synthase [Phycisphaerales bacterium]|nr:3,4-dihydroxy-2-butanone-4-phosphate synthase [Phycisphaerales bacterium]
MHTLCDILADLQQGKPIILLDDERRENEGDIVIPAQFVTSQQVTFMLREACGMMCVALSGDICDRLKLEPLSRINTTQRGTGYTVTVDAHEKFGITTGVSACDRTITIQALANPQTSADDLARPGHVQPLRARDGGVLVRAGQTEGSVDLCKLAGLIPAAVIIEVMKSDGTMARKPDLELFCTRHQLKMCTVADVIHARIQQETLVERIGQSPITTAQGLWNMFAYRSEVDPLPHVALVCGDIEAMTRQDLPVLVRMHSQNLLGDVFEDITQPSGTALRCAMRQIQQAGCGAVVYLRHEGMGQGLLRTLQSVHMPSMLTPQNDERLRLGDGQMTPGLAPLRTNAPTASAARSSAIWAFANSACSPTTPSPPAHLQASA